jgi:hypothetical protein
MSSYNNSTQPIYPINVDAPQLKRKLNNGGEKIGGKAKNTNKKRNPQKHTKK